MLSNIIANISSRIQLNNLKLVSIVDVKNIAIKDIKTPIKYITIDVSKYSMHFTKKGFEFSVVSI